jgi:hypothetical protein
MKSGNSCASLLASPFRFLPSLAREKAARNAGRLLGSRDTVADPHLLRPHPRLRSTFPLAEEGSDEEHFDSL